MESDHSKAARTKSATTRIVSSFSWGRQGPTFPPLRWVWKSYMENTKPPWTRFQLQTLDRSESGSTTMVLNIKMVPRHGLPISHNIGATCAPQWPPKIVKNRPKDKWLQKRTSEQIDDIEDPICGHLMAIEPTWSQKADCNIGLAQDGPEIGLISALHSQQRPNISSTLCKVRWANPGSTVLLHIPMREVSVAKRPECQIAPQILVRIHVKKRHATIRHNGCPKLLQDVIKCQNISDLRSTNIRIIRMHVRTYVSPSEQM